MGLTLRDVALAAGVSTATVSRALRGLDNVDAGTRDRIVAIAREMNFSVSPAASRLATGRTGTIGIVTPFVGRWYFTEIFAGVTEALQNYDVDLLMHTTEPAGTAGPAGAHLRMRRRVDGALAIGLASDSDELMALAELDMPLVLLGSTAPGLSSVSIDDRGASRQAVEHLIERGHERIALISGRHLPTPFVPENDRLAGYLDALQAHGLPTDETLREVGMFTTPGGERAMSALLSRQPLPTAVFCMSDEMAYGALRAMSLHGVAAGGRRAAGEIAVIAFDGHPLADVFDLSTMSQPVRGLGRAATGLLMAQIDGTPHARTVVLPTELVARRSTGGPAGGPAGAADDGKADIAAAKKPRA